MHRMHRAQLILISVVSVWHNRISRLFCKYLYKDLDIIAMYV